MKKKGYRADFTCLEMYIAILKYKVYNNKIQAKGVDNESDKKHYSLLPGLIGLRRNGSGLED
jgi:hypothetical protein